MKTIRLFFAVFAVFLMMSCPVFLPKVYAETVFVCESTDDNPRNLYIDTDSIKITGNLITFKVIDANSSVYNWEIWVRESWESKSAWKFRVDGGTWYYLGRYAVPHAMADFVVPYVRHGSGGN